MNNFIEAHNVISQFIIGKIFPTKDYGNVIVEWYNDANHVGVRFINSGNTKITRTDRIKSGHLTDSLPKKILYNGETFWGCYPGCKHAENAKIYTIWWSMIKRCYSVNKPSYAKSYNGCTVCEEWHSFINFVKWYRQNEIPGKCRLDKDILYKNNKVYGPNTCCIVPEVVNNAFVRPKIQKRDLPIGVNRAKKRFQAHLSKYGVNTYVGNFETPYEAFCAYKREKESYLRELADVYKEVLKPKVYKAIINYQVEITD